MPDISLPEIHLPDVKLPDGLRDMNRQDIQNAIGDARDRIPRRIDMPDIDLSKVQLPRSLEGRLPKSVEDRLPIKRRRNPILPVAAFLAVGAMCAAAWWLITSPSASTRVRETVDRWRYKLTGSGTDVVLYDDDGNLTSLLPEPDHAGPKAEPRPWPETYESVGETVKSGNGSTVEHPASV
ncbi:MAG TPA: hypothetical protein VHS36_01695 [Candidatus Limnocylindrales bacterium]|jgi:hypothetical protein|nr:hypothetical protein [Candidatus Limnocylindrales bacterium]